MSPQAPVSAHREAHSMVGRCRGPVNPLADIRFGDRPTLHAEGARTASLDPRLARVERHGNWG
jgi:hypothetical protein